MGKKSMKVVGVGLVLLFTAAASLVALYVGFRNGTRDDARAEIDSDSEKILATKVPPGFVDGVAGSYRGVAIGDPASAVLAEMGEPRDRDFGIFVPQLAIGRVWSGMGTFSCPGRGRWQSWSYREAVFEVVGDRVCAIQVGGSGWTTDRGFSGGDPAADLRRWPGVECYLTGGYEDRDYDQSMCELVTRSGVKLHFGGDPVTSVTLLGEGKRRRD